MSASHTTTIWCDMLGCYAWEHGPEENCTATEARARQLRKLVLPGR